MIIIQSAFHAPKIQYQRETVDQNISLRCRTLTPFLLTAKIIFHKLVIQSLVFTFVNTLFSNTSFHAGAQRIMVEIPLEVDTTDKSKILSKWNHISIHFVIYVLFFVNISCIFSVFTFRVLFCSPVPSCSLEHRYTWDQGKGGEVRSPGQVVLSMFTIMMITMIIIMIIKNDENGTQITKRWVKIRGLWVPSRGSRETSNL